LYDTAADASDAVALGFRPIWDVMVAPERNTPAFTTIFSFMTALKNQNGGAAAAVNTLMTAQNIDAATMDIYGSSETHVPSTVPGAAALPIYSVATVGGAALVLRTVDDAGHYNRLGNRRYVRFTLNTTRTVTITASSSNPNTPDTDFRVFRNGLFVTEAGAPPAPNETTTLTNAQPGEYLIDVYDCANGCETVQGTPGDYDLTVTVN
jgi:hypothetical protein